MLTAVASYLDAKCHSGRWLVRIEDIDPPREQPGAADRILRTLERFALASDAPVLYQRHRTEAYREALDALRLAGRVFACTCSRRDLAAHGGRYPGTCRGRRSPPVHGSFAWRLRIEPALERVEFADRVQGRQRFDVGQHRGDFVIWRRDALPAYHLAAVVDDAYQQVTDVVRGADLIDSTGEQIHLHTALGSAAPRYAHIPVILGSSGHKLSKQTLAEDVFPATRRAARVLMYAVLELLGLEPEAPLTRAEPAEQLVWAVAHFSTEHLPKVRAYDGYFGLCGHGVAD